MEKLTLNRRNIIIFLSYLFLMVIFFSAGIAIGLKNGGGAITEEVASYAGSIPEITATPVVSPVPSQYRIVLEDGELRLYFDEAGISRLVSGEKISEDLYPVSDIASLKKGIILDTLDEAVSLMENFIS